MVKLQLPLSPISPAKTLFGKKINLFENIKETNITRPDNWDFQAVSSITYMIRPLNSFRFRWLASWYYQRIFLDLEKNNFKSPTMPEGTAGHHGKKVNNQLLFTTQTFFPQLTNLILLDLNPIPGMLQMEVGLDCLGGLRR